MFLYDTEPQWKALISQWYQQTAPISEHGMLRRSYAERLTQKPL